MSEVSERYRKVATQFGERVRAVPADAWGNPSPCTEWNARDVVRHVVETTGWFLRRAGVEVAPAPSVDDDPVAAWEAASRSMQAALDDPEIAGREYDTPMGRGTLEQTVGFVGVGDVLMHTWDLARSTGLDDTLDADEVQRLFTSMRPMGERMRQGGAFGAEVPVPETASVQDKLVAFSGRQP